MAFLSTFLVTKSNEVEFISKMYSKPCQTSKLLSRPYGVRRDVIICIRLKCTESVGLQNHTQFMSNTSAHHKYDMCNVKT